MAVAIRRSSLVAASGDRCRLSPLNGGELEVTGGFWSRRQAKNRTTSLPSGYESLQRAGSLRNLELVAMPVVGQGHRGEYFVDSDVYKWLEAVGWELGRAPDGNEAESLRSLADRVIPLVEAAQAPDGYLNSWFQLRAPKDRFIDLAAAHELYCAGHLFQAAVGQVRGAGDDRLLRVAMRFADHIASVFGPGRRRGVPGHPEIEMALVELYRTTGVERYLDLASFFIDERGHELLGRVHYGARYRQDDVPFREARQARGHAVRAAYLSCGALDVYVETGDRELLDAAVAQWEDMVARRMYITGGVGSRHKDEAFGDPFELPPDRAYCETCAAIGVVMWSWRLLLITGETRYADLIERVLFNAFAVGVALDGGSYFYVNPLQVRAGHEDPEDGRGRAARSPWYEIACCPPNVMRTLSALEHYFATATAEGVQIWQFAPSRLSLSPGGRPLELVVETGYPFEGRVVARVENSDQRPCEIALRVPSWSRGASGTVRSGSGTTVEVDLQPGTLWRVARPWQVGDELVLELPVPVRTSRPHPRIDAVRGCVAFERGPLVYCLEEIDAGSPERVESVRVGPGTTVVLGEVEIADEPVTVLEATVELHDVADENTFPYHGDAPSEPVPTTPATVQLMPYFAWGNRRPGQTMRVWIPESIWTGGLDPACRDSS
jgi:DUF1680 family protein